MARLRANGFDPNSAEVKHTQTARETAAIELSNEKGEPSRFGLNR